MSKFYQPNLKQTNTRYGDMWYFHEDPTIGRSLNLYGEYSQVEIIFMQYFTNSESIVVDIGANIGTHTLGVCQTVGHVIAIEPDQYNYNLLTMNTESRENVTRMRLAISNCTGETGTFFDFGKTKLERGDRCPLVTLDSLELPPDFIKIDVEGMELQCLQGATGILAYLLISSSIFCLSIIDFLLPKRLCLAAALSIISNALSGNRLSVR